MAFKRAGEAAGLTNRLSKSVQVAGKHEVYVMTTKETPLPSELHAQLLDLLPQIMEYLEVEEPEAPAEEELKLVKHYEVTPTTSMVVFEYPSQTEPEPGLAVFTYPHKDAGPPACIACWARTPGQTIEWSVEEFLRYNPVD